MPLYQSIIISKVTSARSTSITLKTLSKCIIAQGGNLRSARILTDRVLPMLLRCNDKNSYLLGRFIQLLYDGNPKIKDLLQRTARQSNDYMKIKTFKVNDPITSAINFLKPVQQTKVYTQQEKQQMINIIAAQRLKQYNKKRNE